MKRRLALGFSLVEVMVSVGLLGIGVAAAIKLFDTAQNRTRYTRSRTTGAELALERLEYLGTRDLSSVPACTGAAGCQASLTGYASPLGASGQYQCTQFVDGQSILDPYSSISTGPYRVDTVVQAHPNSNEANAQLITVSVCWTDDHGLVQQVQGRRLLAYDNTL
jgi:prepilin-type N-terminal cleavage/methylation domain-containing protein